MSQAVMGGHEMPATRLALGGRTMSQGMFGGIALVLGIVGLAISGPHPDTVIYLDAVAQIALGAALIVFGMTLATAYVRLAATAETESAGGSITGTTADMFIGGAVIILGVLSLLHIMSEVLVPVAVILVGMGLLLNGAASARAVVLEASISGDRSLARRIQEEMVFATVTARASAGIAVGVLGILALTGGSALVLTLSAAIVGGAAMLMASTSLSNRLVGTARTA
jgi:hypothetical protein